jgi:hypothetical protein
MPTINLPQTTNIEELRQALQYQLNRAFAEPSVQRTDVDANGYRVTRVARPVQHTDAVNLQYLRTVLGSATDNTYNRTVQYVTNLIDSLPSPVIVANHSSRPSPLEKGQLLVEDDRRLMFVSMDIGSGLEWVYVAGMWSDTYTNRATTFGAAETGLLFYASDYLHTWKWTGSAWQVVDGLMRGTLSPDQKPTLTTQDAGFQFYSTDFDHTYRWTGTTWEYGDGDECSGHIRWWAQTPQKSSVWALADGSVVTKSTRLGTTVSVTTPNLIGAYPKGANIASYTGTIVPATAPTISGNTGSTSAGTPSGTVSGASFTGTPLPSSNVQSGSGATAVPGGSTPSGSVGGSTFTGSPLPTHNHDAGTLAVSSTGEPSHTLLAPYFRL